MSEKIFVRVNPKSGLQKRYRCAMEFTVAWQEVEVDDATALAIDADAYLEMQQTEPDGFERAASADQSSSAVVTDPGGASDTLGENAGADLAQGTDNSANDTEGDGIKPADTKEAGPAAANTQAAETATATAPEDHAERLAAIRSACMQLDRNNDKQWTASGSPKVESLSVIVGWLVSAAERDSAWEEILAGDDARWASILAEKGAQ